MGYRLLLTREGEVEVAKRIEESRKQKLFFLIQTPIALREMQDWYDDILTGKKLLREVIDIDATANSEQSFDEGADANRDDFDNTEENNDDDTDEQLEMEKWYAKRPDWARNKVGCSALSCSS